MVAGGGAVVAGASVVLGVGDDVVVGGVVVGGVVVAGVVVVVGAARVVVVGGRVVDGATVVGAAVVVGDGIGVGPALARSGVVSAGAASLAGAWSDGSGAAPDVDGSSLERSSRSFALESRRGAAVSGATDAVVASTIATGDPSSLDASAAAAGPAESAAGALPSLTDGPVGSGIGPADEVARGPSDGEPSAVTAVTVSSAAGTSQRATRSTMPLEASANDASVPNPNSDPAIRASRAEVAGMVRRGVAGPRVGRDAAAAQVRQLPWRVRSPPHTTQMGILVSVMTRRSTCRTVRNPATPSSGSAARRGQRIV